MKASLILGRIAGIPIGLHYSWPILAVLILMSLTNHFAVTNPGWSVAVRWSAAAVTTLLFFVTLVIHELAHALVARARGVPVRSVTLFALGGVARIDKDAETPRTEFWMGIAGPVASTVIGAGCVLWARALGWTAEGGAAGPMAAVLGWLGSINLVIAVFNLIPGYPLDGGRILRAILWSVHQDVDRATRTAARVGQFVAGLFIFAGVFSFFTGAGFSGLWLAFIGWLLLAVARASYEEIAITASLRDVRALDLMSDDCETVESGTRLDRLVAAITRTGRRCFMVTRDDGGVMGLITPRDIGRVGHDRWASTPVNEVMRPLDGLRTVSPETPASEVLKMMSREDLNQLPVVSAGRFTGIVTRGAVIRLLQTRAELNL